MAFIIPAHKAFDEIERRFGARPTFPTKVSSQSQKFLLLPSYKYLLNDDYHQKVVSKVFWNFCNLWWYCIYDRFCKLKLKSKSVLNVIEPMDTISILLITLPGSLISLWALFPKTAPDLGPAGMLASYLICGTIMFCVIQAIGESITVFQRYSVTGMQIATIASLMLMLMSHIFFQQSTISFWVVGFLLSSMICSLNVPQRRANFRLDVLNEPLDCLDNSTWNQPSAANEYLGSLTKHSSPFDGENLLSIAYVCVAVGWVVVLYFLIQFHICDQLWSLNFYAITITWLSILLTQKRHNLIQKNWVSRGVYSISRTVYFTSNTLGSQLRLSNSTIPSKNREKALVLQDIEYKPRMRKPYMGANLEAICKLLEKHVDCHEHVSKALSITSNWLHLYERRMISSCNLYGEFMAFSSFLKPQFPGLSTKGAIQRNLMQWSGFIHNQNPLLHPIFLDSMSMQHYPKYLQTPRPLATTLILDALDEVSAAHRMYLNQVLHRQSFKRQINLKKMKEDNALKSWLKRDDGPNLSKRQTLHLWHLKHKAVTKLPIDAGLDIGMNFRDSQDQSFSCMRHSGTRR